MDVALLCLALTVFQEARGEPAIGQQAVAQVVLNRARIRDKSVCEVVLEKGQFSWHPERHIITRKNGKNVAYFVDKTRLPVAKKGWVESLRAAKLALASENTVNEAEFFHAKSVKPGWKRRYVEVFRAGNHVFYARKEHFSGKKVAISTTSEAFSSRFLG